MSRRLTLNIPDGTKAISISVVAEGKNIEIEIGRNNQ